MSKPHIKIKKLSILNFRGAKDLLDLNLGSDCKSCAIFGNNAEGKSTFTHSLEWFFKDKIAWLRGEGISEEDIVNLAASEEDDTSVSIVLNKSELNSTKIYDREKMRSGFSNKSQSFLNYINNEARYDRLYLDQHTILWFLSRTKGQKKEEIAKIVGYEDIVKVKSVLSSSLRDIEKDHRLWDAKKNLEHNRGILTKEIYGEAISDIKNLFTKSQKLLEIFGIKRKIQSVEELDESIQKALQLLPSPERAKERVDLENLKADIIKLGEKLNFISLVSTWITNFNNLVKDRETVSKLTMDEFLRQAERVLNDNPLIKVCPLCEQKIESQEDLLKSVIERYRRLAEIRVYLDKYAKELKEIRTELGDIERECKEISRDLKINKITHDSKVIEGYIMSINKIIPLMESKFKDLNVVRIDLSDVEKSIKKMGVTFQAINSGLIKRISSLAITEEEKQRQAAYQKLFRGKQLVLDNISYEKQIAAFNLAIRDLRRIENQMLVLQNRVMQEILDLLSDDANKFFCDLNKKENVKNVKLELKGDEGIEFSLEFYDNVASPPRKYLSESQLNSLGIAFFLAAVKKFNKSSKFFILDDVLVSFDKNYRLRLLDLLEENFSDYQIFLLTHEEYWYQLMKRKFPSWIFKEVYWDFNSGIRFKDIKYDPMENIGEKLAKGEKVGNELRTYLEAFLKDICIALEVKLAHRVGLENERRMIGEMFPALTSTLNKHKSNIQKNKAYKELEVSNFIVTCASHHNPDLLSTGDIEETIEKIKKFRNLFICPKGRIIERKNIVPGQDIISCKCGCLKIEWKEKT